MNVKLQILIIILSILFLIYINHSVKKRNVVLKYALLWIMPLAIVVIVTLIPGVITSFSKLIGIETLSNMMFLFAIVFLAGISYSLTVIVSKQKQKIIILTQELGILKNKFDKMNRE